MADTTNLSYANCVSGKANQRAADRELHVDVQSQQVPEPRIELKEHRSRAIRISGQTHAKRAENQAQGSNQ